MTIVEFTKAIRRQLELLHTHPVAHAANLVVGMQAFPIHDLDKQACIDVVTTEINDLKFENWRIWLERDPTEGPAGEPLDPNKTFAIRCSLKNVAIPPEADGWGLLVG